MDTSGDNYNTPCPHPKCGAVLHYPFSKSPPLGCVTQAVIRCSKCGQRILIEGEWEIKTTAVALEESSHESN